MAGGVDRGAKDAIADEIMLSFGLDDEDDLDFDDEDDLDFDDDGREEFGFGGKNESRVERAAKARAGGGGVATLLGTLSQGVAQSVPPEQLLALFWPQAVQSTLPSAAAPPSSIPQSLVPVTRPPPPLQVEADADSLPPVYVADGAGVDTVRSSAQGKVSSEPLLQPSDVFGASFDRGMVRTRASDKDRRAVVRAKLGSARALRHAGKSSSSPFMEDPGARPQLLSDGRVLESHYGELCFAPCPSCWDAPAESYGRTGNGCVVCDDWGALLVPASDLASWRSAERYGFEAATVSYGIIPLLIALAPAAVPLIGAAGMKGAAARQAEQATIQSRAASVRARLRKEIEGISDQPSVSAVPAIETQAQEVVSGLVDGDDEMLDEDEDSFAGDLDDGLEEGDILGDDLDDGEEDDDLDDLLEDDEDRVEPAVVRMLIPHGRR